MPSEKRKARKQNYFQTAKKSRKIQEGKVLKEGMRGFLLTCNNREKETVREAYNLLNQFADKIFGPEHMEKVAEEKEQSDVEDEDIDAAFEKEKGELVEISDKNCKGERRFQVVESGARNCVFIKTSLDDPRKIVTDIIDDILATEAARARYILRMVPILGTCKAHEKNIEELAKTVLASTFPEGSTNSYSILFKTRNNGSLGREEIIKMIGTVIRELPGTTSVDLKCPDVAIIVEIIRNVCCIGTATEYFGRRKKYNLVELLNKPEEKVETDKKDVKITERGDKDETELVKDEAKANEVKNGDQGNGTNDNTTKSESSNKSCLVSDTAVAVSEKI